MRPDYSFDFLSNSFFYDENSKPNKLFVKEKNVKKCWSQYSKIESRGNYL